MKKVTVKCGYRIHINSLDMNGFNNRCCGGVGFPLSNPYLEVSIEKSLKDDFCGFYPDSIKQIISLVKKEYKLKSGYKIHILHESKRHIGIGSETQLQFALIMGILKIEEIDESINSIAKKFHLADVSGVGYGCFAMGGLVLDLGYTMDVDRPDFKKPAKNPPLLFTSLKMPKNWKVVVVIPKNDGKIFGENEYSFYDKYSPVPVKEVKDLVYHTFMGMVPAIKNENFQEFVKNFNIVSSEGVKKAELLLNKKETSQILARLKQIFGNSALSSSGPTCYAFCDTERSKIDVKKLKLDFANCDVYISSIRNRPYSIKTKNI